MEYDITDGDRDGHYDDQPDDEHEGSTEPGVEYARCDCGNEHDARHMCRNCGTLGRIVERTASLQLRAKLCLSLLRQTHNEAYLHQANRLAHWSRIWITAGQMHEGLVPRTARRLICASCGRHEKFERHARCFRCIHLPSLAP